MVYTASAPSRSSRSVSSTDWWYTLHNLVSAAAAFPIGWLGDRRSKLGVLLVGYGLGVATNVLLAFLGSSLSWLVFAILLSGVYIAAEETLEKAAAADFLQREIRGHDAGPAVVGMGMFGQSRLVDHASLFSGLSR